MTETSKEHIYKLLREKLIQKQEAFICAQNDFLELKSALRETHDDLLEQTRKLSIPLMVEYVDRGDFEVELSIGDDTLIFLLHSNVFTIDRSEEIWKNSYLQEDSSRAYCGQIYIYNFLTDSFKFNRGTDVGYLIGRIFINRENHFYVEGKQQLGFLFNDFPNALLNQNNILQVIESSVIYSLDFDLFAPPYQHMNLISVQEVQESTQQAKILTGKRLGFRFQADTKTR